MPGMARYGRSRPLTSLSRRYARAMNLRRSAGPAVIVAGLVVTLSLPAGAFAVNGCRYAGSNPSISYRFYSVGTT
jgi:hypothetical protein